MRPDVVLVDISGWKEPLEGLVASITGRRGRPHDHRAEHRGRRGRRSCLRCAPASTNICTRRSRRRCAGRSKNAPPSAAGGANGGQGRGEGFAFFSAKGGCGATTLACHVAAELGRQNQKVLLADLDLDAGMVGFITKTKSVYSILDAVNNLHRLDIHYWKALVSNGIPGVEIISSPPGAGLQAAAQGRADPPRPGLRPAALRLDVGGPGPQPEPHRHGGARRDREACLVTTLEVPALHQAKQIIQTLLDGGYGKNRIRLILNRAPKRLDITPADWRRCWAFRSSA